MAEAHLQIGRILPDDLAEGETSILGRLRLSLGHTHSLDGKHKWPMLFEDDVSEASDNEISYDLDTDGSVNGRLHWNGPPVLHLRRARAAIAIDAIPGPVPHGTARGAGLERTWATCVAARETCAALNRHRALVILQHEELRKHIHRLKLLPLWANQGRRLPRSCVDQVMGFLLQTTCRARFEYFIDKGKSSLRRRHPPAATQNTWQTLLRWRLRYDRWRYRNAARNVHNACRTLQRVNKELITENKLAHCPSLLTKDSSDIDVVWQNMRGDVSRWLCHSTCTGALSTAQ